MSYANFCSNVPGSSIADPSLIYWLASWFRITRFLVVVVALQPPFPSWASSYSSSACSWPTWGVLSPLICRSHLLSLPYRVKDSDQAIYFSLEELTFELWCETKEGKWLRVTRSVWVESFDIIIIIISCLAGGANSITIHDSWGRYNSVATCGAACNQVSGQWVVVGKRVVREHSLNSAQRNCGSQRKRRLRRRCCVRTNSNRKS